MTANSLRKNQIDILRVLLGLMILALASIGLWAWLVWQKSSSFSTALNSIITERQAAALENTVAQRWRWDAFAEPTLNSATAAASTETEDYLFDVVQIHDALARVEIDVNGNVVVDERALSALRNAFSRLEGEIDNTVIEQLQGLITIGLPGEAGIQAAQIVGNYYRLINAETGLDTELGTTPSLADRRDHYEKRVSLRRNTLGSKVAAQLFAGEEAHQRFVYASEAINNNSELTTEQKNQQLTMLKHDLKEGILFVDTRGTNTLQELRNDLDRWRENGIAEDTTMYLKNQTLGLIAARQLARNEAERDDWQRRYHYFQLQRRNLLQAGLPNQETLLQINTLLQENFSAAELAAADNYIPDYLLAEQQTNDQ